MEKEKSRKEEIQEQREIYKKIGFYEFVIKPWINSLKEKPIYSIFTFFFWALIFFGGSVLIQSVMFDMTYCDSDLNQYDGKVLNVRNEWTQYVNEQLINPENRVFLNTTMICEQDFNKWKEEPLKERINSITHNFKKIALKEN